MRPSAKTEDDEVKEENDREEGGKDFIQFKFETRKVEVKKAEEDQVERKENTEATKNIEITGRQLFKLK